MKLKHVGAMSVARIAGVLYAVIGLIAGGIFALMALFGAAFSRAMGGGQESFLGPIFGVGAVIFMPILYGILGAVGGGFCAWLYNVLAGMLGGVELDLE